MFIHASIVFFFFRYSESMDNYNNERTGEFMNFFDNTHHDDFLRTCFGNEDEQPVQATPPVQDDQPVQASPPVQKSRSGRSKRSRGPTTSVDGSCVTSPQPRQIKYNETGYPIGDKKRTFSAWLGTAVRNRVDICIMEWKDVPHDIKETIWKETKVN